MKKSFFVVLIILGSLISFNCARQISEDVILGENLIQAIRQNNITLVDSFLINEPDQLLARDKLGFSAMHYASRGEVLGSGLVF
jgi:hypothetical protein